MSDYRVALISHEFPPYIIGGVGIHCYDLALSLSKKKVNTTVFCGRSKITHTEKINDYLEVVRLPYFDFPPRHLWFQLQNLRILSKILGEHDIIHGVVPHLTAICGYFKRKMKRPLITSIHEVIFSDLKLFMNSPLSEWTIGNFGLNVLEYPLNDFLIKASLKKSDHIIVCGSSALNDMKKIYRNLDFAKVSTIYNGINFDRINENGNNDMQKGSSIIFHGRLVWTKGILHLIKAIAILKKDFPDLNLKIFGNGPLEGKIKSLISKLGLKNRIHLKGFVPNAELLKHIKKAGIVVLPSFYEVGPFIAALEAMACKKPLVVFDFPFTREFISNMHNGILAKAGDVKDLSEKIRLLLSDEILCHKIGQNAYQYVKRSHNWDILVENYIELYENCISH